MKTMIKAAVVAAALALPAKAAELSAIEKGYIGIALTSMSVANLCGYDVVPGSLNKLGDRLGVSDAIGIAALEAIKMTMSGGKDYDRSLLIPEVTRFVDQFVDAMVQATKNQPKYCREYAPKMLDQGRLRAPAVATRRECVARY